MCAEGVVGRGRRGGGMIENTLVFIAMLALTLLAVWLVSFDAAADVVACLLFKVVKQFVTRRSTGCILLLQQLQQMFVANDCKYCDCCC